MMMVISPKKKKGKRAAFFLFFRIFFCTKKQPFLISERIRLCHKAKKATLRKEEQTHSPPPPLLLLLSSSSSSSQQQQQQQQKQQHNTRRSVVTRADWSLGSDVNHCVCFNTVALLFAGRFGFAPTVKKNYSGADSYTMTEDAKPAVGTRDPAGFTAVDVLAFGSLAHIVSAGEIFGLHLN